MLRKNFLRLALNWGFSALGISALGISGLLPETPDTAAIRDQQMLDQAAASITVISDWVSDDCQNYLSGLPASGEVYVEEGTGGLDNEHHA
jgi:hypothetical protein